MFSIFKKKSLKELIYSNELDKLKRHITVATVNHKDENGKTALHYAIKSDNFSIVEFLINNKADLTSIDNEQTLIKEIIDSCNSHILQLVIDNGFTPPPNIIYNDFDTTPILHYLIEKRCRNYNFFQILIDYSIDINIINNYGYTILALALTQPHTDPKFIELLIENGIDVQRAGSNEKKPIYCLIDSKNKSENEKIRLLKILINSNSIEWEHLAPMLIVMVVADRQTELFLSMLEMAPHSIIIDTTNFEVFLVPLFFTPKQQERLIAVNIDKKLNLPISIEISGITSWNQPEKIISAKMIFDLSVNLDVNLVQKRILLNTHIDNGGDVNILDDWENGVVSSISVLASKSKGNTIALEHIKELLNLGVKIEFGGHSALFYAVNHLLLDSIELLIHSGANPLYIDNNGNSLMSTLMNCSRCNVNSFNIFNDVLKVFFKLLKEEDLEILIRGEHRYEWNGGKRKTITFINWIGLQQSHHQLKITELMMQEISNLNIYKFFSSQDATIITSLLKHLLTINDSSLIEQFFEKYSDYKIKEDAEVFVDCLSSKTNTRYIKAIIDITENLTLNKNVLLNSKCAKVKFNYLLILAYYSIRLRPEQNIGIANYLLERGVDINQKGDYYLMSDSKDNISESTFLLECVHADALELFEWGLKNGADANAKIGNRSDTLTTAIIAHSRNNNEDRLILFLELLKEYNLLNINLTNNLKSTPILAAASQCKYTILDWLIKEGGDVNVVGGYKGLTPLISAITEVANVRVNVRVKVVQALINSGVNINQIDNEGKTALINAAYYGELSVVILLLKAGADVSIIDEDGSSVVNHTILGQHDYEYKKEAGINEHIKRQILELLAENKADLNFFRSDGQIPLVEAIRFNREILFDALIDLGADINYCDEDGWTPLMWSLIYGSYRFTHKLIEHKNINLAIISNRGEDLWNTVVKTGNLEETLHIFRRLKDEGIAPCCSDISGQHPLHIAAKRVELKLVSYLLDNFDCVNALNNEGCSPIFNTIMADNTTIKAQLDVCSLLIERGADLNIKNMNGNTPLKLAQGTNTNLLSELLIKHGANPANGKRKMGFNN